MRGQELVALAGAHGIKLEHIQMNGAAAPRGWADGCEIISNARGSGSPWRRTRRHERSDEPGEPEEIPWCAARYSFAGDVASYWPLWYALASWALRTARREGWPPQVAVLDGTRRFYVLELVTLVLDEEANRPLFVAAPQLRALYMQVEAYTWDEALAPRYRVLQAVYQRWLGTARATIQGWLSEQEPQAVCGDLAKRIEPPAAAHDARKAATSAAPL